MPINFNNPIQTAKLLALAAQSGAIEAVNQELEESKTEDLKDADTKRADGEIISEKKAPPKPSGTNTTNAHELNTAEIISRINNTIFRLGVPLSGDFVGRLFNDGIAAASQQLSQSEKQQVLTARSASPQALSQATQQIAVTGIRQALRSFTEDQKEKLGLTPEIASTADKIFALLEQGFV